ncbi:methyl-accepting chemotaxis sensory transducer with TarH sensor [Ectothiorhodospira mobilis]|uniref:Methyl-accepting chemotaxis sensory transducer with TarH sensor n=1 Tax=Ectothiorhodospira mobilis TaxID=195064 RepID=A0A1I4PT52_ECTMO|nr:methyl-accepting chemotaxis protein [Ectothiorhodospira mobilis]SFM30934.1 methyl-accepting chemotaxis sensory transducer with TarH sensor [Ectothiorhodospira mobilis]
MRWFNNMPAGVKIGLLSGVLLLSLAYAIYEAFLGFNHWSDYSEQVRDNRLPSIQALGALNTERMAIRAQTVEVLDQEEAYDDKTDLREIARERTESWRVIDENWERLQGIPRLTETGRRAMAELETRYQDWREIYVQLDRLLALLINTREPERFDRLMVDYRETMERMVPISNAMGMALEDLVEGNMQRASAQADEAVVTSSSEIRQLLWLSALAILISLALAVLTILGLARPLRTLVEHFHAIGNGDYDQKIQQDRRDEVGQALKGLADMQAKLKADIGKTKRMAAENLRIRYALDSVSSNVMVSDVEGQIIYANDAVIGMFRRGANEIRKDLPNFDPEQVRGGNVDLFHRNPGHQRQMMEAMRSTYETEIRIGGRTFKLIANPISDDEGERLGTVIEWADRTEELKVENEVSTLVEGAVKGDFTRRVATEELDGFFKRLGSGVNTLMEKTATGLGEVANVLNAIAQGDLTRQVTGDYEGTFGELKRDTNNTAERLRELIGQIQESVDAINTAAKEIASGNTDLSQRTEEQASSLEETASSMEELTSTVKQTADNARQADQLSDTAREVATRGGDKARQAMESMKAITESSDKIGDIITVIDGIAFQTNILALNAAVEAARAGEQGRGFAVVAGEVRNLAQRSASAAKEIKALIAEDAETIQTGSRQVMEAGETMEEIVEQVKRVSDLIAEIAAASDEQSSGIEQVNSAVTQMDEVTQQNASLVEEAAAAAESLEEQSQGLARAVSVFRLSEQQGSGGLPAPARRETRALPGSGSKDTAHTARSGTGQAGTSRQRAAGHPPHPQGGSGTGKSAPKAGGGSGTGKPAAGSRKAPPAAADDEWEEF